MDRYSVYKAADGERDWQDRKWGTIDQHPHEVGGWLTIMRTLLARAETAWASSAGDDAALEEVRKLLGTCVACGEQHGLPTRWKHGEMERMRHG